MAKKPDTTKPDGAGEWFTLDPAVLNNTLTPPGDYAATIVSARISRKPDVAWLLMDFALDDTGEIISAFACVACAPKSAHAAKRARGLRMLSSIMAAGRAGGIGSNPNDIPKIISGFKMSVTIAHDTQGGIPELQVRSVKPLPKEV